MKTDMIFKFLSNHASICAAVYVNIKKLHITSGADDFTCHFHPTHPMHTFPEPWEAWPVKIGGGGDHIMVKFFLSRRMDFEVWKNMQEPTNMNININGGKYLTRQSSTQCVSQGNSFSAPPRQYDTRDPRKDLFSDGVPNSL
jgi:hypothetical protein